MSMASSAPNSSLANQHPFGEHPSRTLFVRNINSNVEDDELRALFEAYGPIRSMYTQCKHRGFVMISYFDIRHAKNAMRHLQTKVLRRRKLDIHYSIPKDNPSDKDVNQGTLVVFNLDPSITNEELLETFGAFGEIKEIRETPNKKHHKFIEFYDVRDAEKAMKHLNKTEIKVCEPEPPPLLPLPVPSLSLITCRRHAVQENQDRAFQAGWRPKGHATAYRLHQPTGLVAGRRDARLAVAQVHGYALAPAAATTTAAATATAVAR